MQLTSLQRERLRGFLGYLQLQEETGLVIIEDEKLLPTLKKELQLDEMVEARNSDEVVRMLKRKTSPFIVLTNENAQELSALERYIKTVTFNRNEITPIIVATTRSLRQVEKVLPLRKQVRYSETL